ncbi:MAG: hypothetical protein HN403_00800 [Rhodospirillales bacterium]|jgi:hypothetical protein|nr:hypothetical protein [Rhodospirillales bacterium]
MSQGPFDIVIIGDLRFPGGVAAGMSEHIRAQAKKGYRTALVQIKGPVLKYPHPFHPRIRECLDEGLAELVDPDQEISAALALAYHPQVFTHLPSRPLRITAERKLLIINHPLIDGAGQPCYDWQTIDANVQESLGGDVLWSPVGPLARPQPGAVSNPPPLFDDDWFEIVDVDAWAGKRDRFVGDIPVIGRHSRPDYLKWPDDPETTLAAYPDDPAFKVRILGAGDFLTEHVGSIPANWEMLPFNSVDPVQFLSSIDFFVYHHHSTWVEAFGRVIVEAMANGALAILPRHFEVLFGDGAIYAEPQDVRDTVQRYYLDKSAVIAQRKKADAVVREKFSHEAYAKRLKKLVGPPRKKKAAKKPLPRAQRRALFVTSNGVGMGHLTRMLAVARRCAPDIQPVFATMSQAFRVVHDQGFMCEYIPFHGHLRCDMASWNHFLRHEINELISFYDPSILVFDGNVAYGGLTGALQDNPGCLSVWCRRALWRPGARAEENIRRESSFDAVIEQGEVAGDYDSGLTTLYRGRTRNVAPVRLLDSEELLARDDARRELGLNADGTVVLIQLGSQNNYDYAEVQDAVINRLSQEPDTQIVVAEWLISHEPAPLPDGVKRVRAYPLGKYFNAFDFTVSAAGYNGFHELLFASVPSIFVPNENPMMDEQLARAQFAERNGLGVCLRTREMYKARACVERLLDETARADIRQRCASLDATNGATEIARFVEECVFSLRGDKELRGYWSAT